MQGNEKPQCQRKSGINSKKERKLQLANKRQPAKKKAPLKPVSFKATFFTQLPSIPKKEFRKNAKLFSKGTKKQGKSLALLL